LTTYAIGDIQGCLEPLKHLLDKVKFDPATDSLWSVGDLVNRGPDSLETLRFCYNLGNSFRMVLGNHDLHLLAVSKDIRPPSRSDTLDEILQAPDKSELLHWLQRQPLMIEDHGYVMVHAGIPPQWSLEQARTYANEINVALCSHSTSQQFFNAMYGNEPDLWQENLTPPIRWRAITNYFTRMRFCSEQGHMEFSKKTSPEDSPNGYKPWFQYDNRLTKDTQIIFGHWAALEGKACGKNLFPLDTGYIWGGPMRLMNLETKEYIQHQSRQPKLMAHKTTPHTSS
tara:strand:- start:18854 stop:19705 length:852 start_codon:yes stop_codon:yes gene_type:complete